MSVIGKQRFENQVAIVTGAGRGLGRAEALALAEGGARVVVNDLGGAVSGEGAEASVAQAVVDEIRTAGGEAVANTDSIATMAGGKAVVEAAMDHFGRLDILINNAGNARPSVIYEMTEEDWDAVIAVHLKGLFATTRHAAPIFRDQRSGVIVNTASQSGLGHYGMANYAAAKEGVVGFTRTVARDLGHYGVRCNAIRPLGGTRMGTPEIMDTIRISQEELGFAGNGNVWITGSDEFPTPEQVAVFATWLCTDAAKDANGRTFHVGGDLIGIYPEPDLQHAAYYAGGWTHDTLDAKARQYLLNGEVNLFAGKQR